MPLALVSCPLLPGSAPLADEVPWLPCGCPLWLPAALSRPGCGAGAPGTDADLELLELDAAEGLPADPLEVEALDEELEEDELEGIEGLDEEDELDDELDDELELEDDELDGVEGIELCEDCWLVDSQAAKSRDAAPIRRICVTGDLFIWLRPITKNRTSIVLGLASTSIKMWPISMSVRPWNRKIY